MDGETAGSARAARPVTAGSKHLRIDPNHRIYPQMGTQDDTDFDRRRLDEAFSLLVSVEELSTPLALALLAIAREPGLSINQLGDRLRVPQQTASRYAAQLQGRYQSSSTVDFARNPLLSLEVSAHDPRSRALYLTAHGKKRVADILQSERERDQCREGRNLR